MKREISIPTPPYDAMDQTIDKLSNKVIRAVLSLENKRQMLTPALIQSIWRSENQSHVLINFRKRVFPVVQEKLRRLFGMELVMQVPKASAKNKAGETVQLHVNPDDPGGATTCFILCDIMTADAKEVISNHFSRNLSTVHDRICEQSFTFSNYDELNSRPVTGDIFEGFMSLIVCLVALGGEAMSQDELFDILRKQFRVNCADKCKYTLLGALSVTEFMKKMCAQEYLTQTVHKDSETGQDYIEYRVGRRNQTEFHSQAMGEFMKKLYGDEWTTEMSDSFFYTLHANGIAISAEHSHCEHPVLS